MVNLSGFGKFFVFLLKVWYFFIVLFLFGGIFHHFFGEEHQNFWCPQIKRCKMKGSPTFFGTTFLGAGFLFGGSSAFLVYFLCSFATCIRISFSDVRRNSCAWSSVPCRTSLKLPAEVWWRWILEIFFRAGTTGHIFGASAESGAALFPKVCKIWDVWWNKKKTKKHQPWGRKQRSCRFRTCCFLVSYRGVLIVHLFIGGRWVSNRARLVWRSMSNLWPR